MMEGSLEKAVRDGDLQRVQELIGRGADVNEPCEEGSLLILAIMGKQRHIALALLSAGANVDRQDAWGNKALFWACANKLEELVQAMIDLGCPVNEFSTVSKAKLMSSPFPLIPAISPKPTLEGDSKGRCTPLMDAAYDGHEKLVKILILAGANVGMQDENGNTALHHAALGNHIQTGIFLVEGGASVKTKNTDSQTPLDVATPEFKEAMLEALSFSTRKTLCVIGDAGSGKSTLIAALQATPSNSILNKFVGRFKRVDDHRKRTAGIETVPHCSKSYGEVLFYDFAGQHEYHGPHQMFLQSFLEIPGVSIALLLVVKATAEEDDILHQLHRWLSPVALMAPTTSAPQVIVVGSFLDKVKSKQDATAKLNRCVMATIKKLLSLEFVGICTLNCRQPQSTGIDQLSMLLQDVPIPDFRATPTQYSLPWVLSQIRSTFKSQPVQLQTFSTWIQENKDNLPRTMPPPEKVCQDLSAAGHAVYLSNMEDPSKSWLVLDLPSILHDVYGTLFSQSKGIVNEFGLLHCRDLAKFFPELDAEVVQQLLISLEFCIPVDPSFPKAEVKKLTQSEDVGGWLFFPALICAKCPHPKPPQHSVCLCWQLRTSKKDSIPARVLQTILLRLAAHFVTVHANEEGVRQHCCSIWQTGIAWQSKKGVEVTVHFINNRMIQMIGASISSATGSCQYLTDVISDILSTVRELSSKLAAAAYIVRPGLVSSCWQLPKLLPPGEEFLVETIQKSITGHEEYTLSLKDVHGRSTQLPVSDLFGCCIPSLEDIEKMHWTQPEPSHPQSPAFANPQITPSHYTNPPPTPTATSTNPQAPCALTATSTTCTQLGAQALLEITSRPTQSDVNELIVTQIAAKWKRVAIMLRVEDFLIDAIYENHPKDCIASCQDMLKRWLNEEMHTGGEERTWSALLTALGKADCGELVRSLRKEHFRPE